MRDTESWAVTTSGVATRTRHRHRLFTLVSAALFVTLSQSAEAQRDTAVPLYFDFISPGAKSLALAGAFTAVADDATAAATNPAGLVRMPRRPEVSFEGRLWRYVTPFVNGGRSSGVRTSRGIDQFDELQVLESNRDALGLSFASYVHPVGPIRVAGYRQEVSRLRAAARTQGFFFRRASDPETDRRELPFDVSRRVHITHYGGAVGVALGRSERLAVGGGVQVARFSISTMLRGYEYPEPGGTRDLYAPADYAEQLYEGRQNGTDTAVTFNAGVSWVATESLQIGATFKRGASFEFDGAFRYPERLGRVDPRANSDYRGRFKTPDVLSAGARFQSVSDLVVTVEFTHVRYSQLLTFIQDSIVFDSADPQLYSIPNSNEWHAGLEYIFSALPRLQPAVRAGVWRDPDHALRYAGADDVWKVLPAGKSLTHISLGAGIAPGAGRDVEINGGVDISSRPIVVSVSALFRF